MIVATGDLTDYQFEFDDDPRGWATPASCAGSSWVRRPGPDFPDVEELRVPIFMTPGNHDYRKHPYYLVFELALDLSACTASPTSRTTGCWKARPSRSGRSVRVATGVPRLDIGTAGQMVAIDPDARPFRACLADGGSYVVRLGAHRLVLLDSAHDVGVLTGTEGLIKYIVNVVLTENERTFADASPNSEGVEASELELVTGAMAESPGGLVVVGIHAPLFNLWNDEYPYFLRETQRPQQRGQDYGYLARHGRATIKPPLEKSIESLWPLWFSADDGHRSPTFVKRGGTGDLLDYAVSRGHAEDLVRLLAGIGSPRAADVVLAGHTHRHNEFVVQATGTGELSFSMDFYTDNPVRYYPTPFVTGYRTVVRPRARANRDPARTHQRGHLRRGRRRRDRRRDTLADAIRRQAPQAAPGAALPDTAVASGQPARLVGHPPPPGAADRSTRATGTTPRSASAASGCCRSQATSSRRGTPSPSAGLRRTPTGWRWRTPSGRTRPALTGTSSAPAGTTRPRPVAHPPP